MAIHLNTTIQTVEPTTDTFCMHGMAFTAPYTGVCRVDKNNRVSLTVCLVCTKIPELPEIPFVNGFIPFCFAVSDVGEVFHSKSIINFEFSHDCLADDMVHICLKPLLPPRHLLEMSLGGFCAFGLETSTQSLISFQHRNHGVVVELFIRGDCYRVYSDINTDYSVATKKFGIDVFGDHDMQEHPLFTVMDKVSTVDIPFSILFVMLGDADWYFDSTFDGAQGDDIVFDAETSCIISYGEIFFENRLRPVVRERCTKGFTGFISATANKLCRKVKHTSYGIIGRIMQSSFVADVLSKSNICNNLCRCRILFHCFKKNRFCRYLDFHGGNSFHTRKHPSDSIYSFLQFLPRLKSWVSLEGFI